MQARMKAQKQTSDFLQCSVKIKLQFYFLIVIQKARIEDQQHLYVFRNKTIPQEFGHEELLYVVCNSYM